MDTIIAVASYIITRYKDIAGKKPDEMKLHKMLYFAQRESYAQTGEPLFEEFFKGWKFGPVNEDVRAKYKANELIYVEVSPKTEFICNKVVEEYGPLESWKLSEMTHEEISWLNARKNISANQNGNKVMSNLDIKEDSKKIRLFDNSWGMYSDEDSVIIDYIITKN